jgi:hypothetical protein
MRPVIKRNGIVSLLADVARTDNARQRQISDRQPYETRAADY